MFTKEQGIWALVVILVVTAVVSTVVTHFVRRELVARYPYQDPYNVV